MRLNSVVLLFFAAIVVRELWTIMPDSNATFDPFPLYDIEITWQTYVYFICSNVSMLILIYAFGKVLPEYWTITNTWFILQAIEFVDYFFTYNTAWFLHINITVIKLLVLFPLILYKIVHG